MNIDVILDVSRGDCSKAKVAYTYCKYNKYDLAVRLSGGSNTGATAYHLGEKFVTHLIPTSVLFGIPSVIGRNCLVQPRFFLEELAQLQEQFNRHPELKILDLRKLVKIDGRACIITEEHVAEDSLETEIGTTKKGVGPAARDKYARKAQQAKDIPELQPFVTDLISDIYNYKYTNILAIGTQGHYLDPHFGDYPYVTSTHCGIAAVSLNGLPLSKLREKIGVIKCYETYVGSKIFQGADPIFAQMAEVGFERGSTTGRLRQCNFLNLQDLLPALFVNDISTLVVSKMDVLQKLNCWKVIDSSGIILDLKSEGTFKYYLVTQAQTVNSQINVKFSYQPYEI